MSETGRTMETSADSMDESTDRSTTRSGTTSPLASVPGTPSTPAISMLSAPGDADPPMRAVPCSCHPCAHHVPYSHREMVLLGETIERIGKLLEIVSNLIAALRGRLDRAEVDRPWIEITRVLYVKNALLRAVVMSWARRILYRI